MARAKRPRRKETPRVLIVTEGETEKAYFDEFRQANRLSYSLRIRCAGAGSKVCSEAKKQIKAQPNDEHFDAVVLVFDHDNDQILYSRNCKECQNESWRAVRSNVCFEVWFLAHETNSASGLAKPSDVEARLKQCTAFSSYRKGKGGYWSALESKLSTATANAAQWHRVGTDHPFTQVGELIRDLLDPEFFPISAP